MDRNVAFSNPIYGEIREQKSPPSFFRPVPTPRLSKIKCKQDDDNINSNLIRNQQNRSSIIQDIPMYDNKRSSLCLGDIRMTQILEEINSLTDSLQKNFSSLPENVDLEESKLPQQTSTTTNQNEVQKRTIKRKKISVKSDLLKIALNLDDSNDEKFDPSSNDDKNSNKVTTNSIDSGVFLMASQKSVCEDEIKPKEDENNTLNKESEKKEEEPPKLPPRKPFRLDVVPKMDPIKSYEEQLDMEHLHNDTLSLQRSGYLWKTGPSYKSFKNRWCVMYRHSQNYFDANISYYFNRSSMSASLSGKILLAEIEFIAVTETIPTKTRLPKIEKVNSSSCGGHPKILEIANNNGTNNDRNNQLLCFFEIGVKSRQGRVYLFAARSDSDRQQWIHAFVQAITLHAFKNKEIYHCGFVRAKFTITAKWQTCFAILTTDRFFYVFELEQDNAIPTLDCKLYHIFNLRKTVRLNRMDENSMNEETGNRKSIDSIKESCSIDCKFGFSLTQDGGHVVYLISVFESHINLWYRSIWRFWLTPRKPPEKMTLEEQYLTRENVPVAFDKCLKFLDTFNQNRFNLFGPMQDSIHEAVVSRESPEKSQTTKLSNHSNQQKIQASTTIPDDMDLWTQQNLLAQLRFDSWNVHLLPQKYNACQISQLLLLYLRSMNECVFTETLLPYWIKLFMITNKTEETRSDIDSNKSPKNDQNSLINSKNEQMKRLLKLMPQVNYATLRRFIIYFTNETYKNEEYYLSTSLCKTLFFSKQNKISVSVSIARFILMSLIKNYIWLFEITKEELEKELHIKRVVNLIISQNRKQNGKKQPDPRMKMIRSYTNDYLYNKHNGQKVNSLIIGIKVTMSSDNQQTTVNVHINQSTTANEIFEMILEKVKLDDNEEMLNNYSVFEVLCNRRLERIIMGKEKILPLVLCWSNWPSHWSMDACIEIKPTEQLLRGQQQDKKIKLPNLKVIRFENESLNYSPTMLMSVIRYCGQSDNRLVKHVLAEFSSSQLFLYCKETHHLLGQYSLEDIYWYVGIESSSIFQNHPVKCASIVDENEYATTGMIFNTKSNKSTEIKQGQQQLATTTVSGQHLMASIDYNGIPSLTFIERNSIKSRQGPERRNFGQTLVFNSGLELDQWIKGLLQASFHKELFKI